MLRAGLAAVLLMAAAPAGAAQPLIGVERFEMRVGDRGPWSPVTFYRVPGAADEVWLRATVDVPGDLRREGQPLGIYVAALASHEVWWDGALLGRGGTVGRSAAEERPGPLEAHYQVPDRLAAPGAHALLLRTSAFHRHFSPWVGYWAVIVGDYEAIVQMRRADAWMALVALSGLVLTALFALALFGLTRDRPALLLGLVALCAAGVLVAESWRPILGYTYDRHIVRLGCVLAFSWLTGVLLVALVVTRFPARHGRLLLALATAGSTVVPFFMRGWDGKSLAVHLVCLSSALLWSVLAAVRRAPSAVPAAIGIAGAWGALWWNPWWFLDSTLYFSFLFLFLCLLWSHAVEVRRDRAARAAAELRSARLELEMLKRHLQPHFLMNTLTALAEWVEQDPRTAVTLIDAIADEFRLLADLACRRLVRADEELRLCRNHLQTMSLRRDVRYDLEVRGVRGDELLPPAVLHTLVENAVTHGAQAPQVTLRLVAEPAGARTRFVLESPADGGTGPAVAGTGTRYVEARLREAWGADWSFRQGREGASWRAELVVPATGATA